MNRSSILEGTAIAYRPTGQETSVLVPIAGTGELVWRKVQDVCWHAEEGYDTQLIGFWVEGMGLRRARVVVNGR